MTTKQNITLIQTDVMDSNKHVKIIICNFVFANNNPIVVKKAANVAATKKHNIMTINNFFYTIK